MCSQDRGNHVQELEQRAADAVLYTLLIGSMAASSSTLVSWARTLGAADSWYDTGVIVLPIAVGAVFALRVSGAWRASQLLRVLGRFVLLAPAVFVLVGIPALTGGLMIISLNAAVLAEVARFTLPLFSLVSLLWVAMLDARRGNRRPDVPLLVVGGVLAVLAVVAIVSVSSADTTLAVPDPLALLITGCLSLGWGVATAMGEDTTRHGDLEKWACDVDHGRTSV